MEPVIRAAPLEYANSGRSLRHGRAKGYGEEILALLGRVWPVIKGNAIPNDGTNIFARLARMPSCRPVQNTPGALLFGMIHFALFIAAAAGQPEAAKPEAPKAAEPPAWAAKEAPFLTNHKQLTLRENYTRAGESYFSADGKWMIFQAVATTRPGVEPDPYYAMYVAKLSPDKTSIQKVEKVSGPGSANTCGWFHPTEPWRLLFGSTLVTPKEEVSSGYQRGTSRYKWAFPAEMEVTEAFATQLWDEGVNERIRTRRGLGGQPPKEVAEPPLPEKLAKGGPAALFKRSNYDAECSYDKTGRFVLYSHVEEAPKPREDQGQDGKPAEGPPRADANIYIFDTKTQKTYPLVVQPGYDGGPFFSPDGKWICYRSDRKGNELLQIFVARLSFTRESDGTMVPTGVSDEFQITDNECVNWCPFFHPSGKFLVYGTSEVDPVRHSNYEIFALELDYAKFDAVMKGGESLAQHKITDLKHRRLTFADGADVLPAFNAEGTKMIWCSGRGPKAAGEERPSPQVWIADWNGNPFESPAK